MIPLLFFMGNTPSEKPRRRMPLSTAALMGIGGITIMSLVGDYAGKLKSASQETKSAPAALSASSEDDTADAGDDVKTISIAPSALNSPPKPKVQPKKQIPKTTHQTPSTNATPEEDPGRLTVGHKTDKEF